MQEEAEARRVEDHRQQQVFQPGGVDQPDPVERPQQRQRQHRARVRAARHQLQAEAGAEQVGDQRHRGGQLDQCVVARGVEEGHQQQRRDQRAGQPQCRRWGFHRIGAAEQCRRGVRWATAGQVEHFHREHGPGQQRAADRNDQPDVDQRGAPGAHRRGHHLGHRGVLHLRQFVLRHHAQRQHRDADQQQQGDHEAEQGCTADIGRVPRVAGIDRGALDAEEYPDGVEHGGFHLAGDAAQGRAAPEVQVKGLDAEGQGYAEDEQGDRHHLGEGHDGVGDRRVVHAVEDEGMHQPEHRQFAEQRRPGGSVAEEGQRAERAEGAEQHHQVAGVADPGGNPVAPGSIEPQVFAEAFAGVAVDAVVQFGAGGRQPLEYPRQGQHADEGDRPGDQDRAGACAFGHVLRQAEDTAADDAAYHQRGQRRQPQFSLVRIGHVAPPKLHPVCRARRRRSLRRGATAGGGGSVRRGMVQKRSDMQLTPPSILRYSEVSTSITR